MYSLTLCILVVSTFGFSEEKNDPDVPTPQQEKALSQYLEAVANTGVKGVTIALQVVDQFNKPINKIPVQFVTSAWIHV